MEYSKVMKCLLQPCNPFHSQGSQVVLNNSVTKFCSPGKSALEDLEDLAVASPPKAMCACTEGKFLTSEM